MRLPLMTGTGAGGIDWLIENVRVAEIEIDAPDEDGGDPRRVPTFLPYREGPTGCRAVPVGTLHPFTSRSIFTKPPDASSI